MSKLDKFKRKDKNSDNVWSSISDLMSGLMIVFLFTSVIFMSKVIDENTNIKKQQQTVENIVTTYEESKENIYEDLYNEFEGDMDNWHMEIDKDGTIRFKEPEVFFDMGESELKTQFKDILDSFFPRYINVIYTNYKDKVTETDLKYYIEISQKLDNSIELELYQDENKIEEFTEKLEEKYEDCDIQMYKGDQPLYYFIMAVE